jgi:hypothetical protein
MNKVLSLALSFAALLNCSLSSPVLASSLDGLKMIAGESPTPAFFKKDPDPWIKGFHRLDAASGLVYTADSAFITTDTGVNWIRLPLPATRDEVVASAEFGSPFEGTVLLFNSFDGSMSIARTSDGGQNWSRTRVILHEQGSIDLDLENARIAISGNYLEIVARIPTSSNFRGHARLVSLDGGKTWQTTERIVGPNSPDELETGERDGNWALESFGECQGFKTGCVQASRLLISGGDATPEPIRQLVESKRAAARTESARAQMFALPPGGSTRISLNRGFDKCQAGSVAQMQIWWDNSYHFDANIYFSGRARACPTQPFTNNPAWIDQVSAQGWGLIPTVVGYQSHKHSNDPAVAEQQGRGEADIAAADAASIGLTAGSVLYYDMERYDETASTPGCRTSTTAFLKGWTERIRQLGYVSGVYGSPKNAIEDWQSMPPASRMDAVWMARWDNVPSVWTYISFANFPNNVWDNHQRIKQWQAPHNETWGGVTFNIDGNISDGPVAGIPFSRNKVADFDGDGKTDISVYRPSTGQWFVSGTRGPSFNIYEYGTAEDILAPGDYDGDGKTDLAVFRPSNSTWYVRSKGMFSVRQYGDAGDVAAPADYDGDGRTDIAVFRPSTGTWFIAYNDSRNTYAQIQFGQAGDRPASADYDGDGKADIAVWRPSNGTWYVQGTAGNFFASEWGEPNDIPAQGDYDGDGRVDMAVFRPGNGRWYLLQTTAGIRTQDFGVEGDLPATGDYDGDGRYDVAVFRPSENTWYTSQSQAGFIVRQFGADGDKTIPGAYLPK